MKNIILISPPATGKGTVSNYLVKKYGYIHISTGDLLREEMAKETLIGRKVKALVNKGEFVPDDIVIDLISDKLKNNIDKKPFILDGFPRNIHQAEVLKKVLEKNNQKIDVVIELVVNKEVALKRACSRLICPACKKTFKQDKTECDDCNSTLISRGDDNEKIYNNRYEIYLEQTFPLLEFYKSQGIVIKVDNNSDNIEALFQKVLNIVKDEVGTCHGRFQVLHKGHLKYFLEAKKRCNYLIIGICRPDAESSEVNCFDAHRAIKSNNMLTYYERLECIKGALVEAGIPLEEFEIVPFPIDDPDRISNFAPKDAKYYMTIFEPWGYEKKKILENKGFCVEVLFGGDISDKDYNSTDVRKKMLLNQNWTEDVPPFVAKYIKDNAIDERIIKCLMAEENKTQ